MNERGQVTNALSGSDVTSKLTYSTSGYLERKQVETSDQILMRLDTSFNQQRGTLNSRSNSMFSWSETFEYDDLDRLISFDDNSGDNSQSYDSSGRIMNNSTVGDYNYNGNSYQVANVDLNNQGDLYYQQHQVQQVKYNAFKKPFEIEEEGVEKIGFQYNAFMGRSHMFYGDTEEELEDRNNRKHYSHDGSMEISHDESLNRTTFVTYIGGDGYSAPAIWKSEQATFGGFNDFYYLHRDYLGSIMLITNGGGLVEEKRHFDAWGNTVKVTNGNGITLDGLTFLDRGYTGHEHLEGVGLIHMNGRLYDPKLKRFLSADNFIQDIGNTQNFNRYGYVLNNPLMYTDPTGNMYDGGGSETGGLSGTQQTIIGAVIASAASIDWKPVGQWIDTNATSVWRDVTGAIDTLWEGVKGLFKAKVNRAAPIEYTFPSNLSSDPLASSSASTGLNFFGVTGSSGGLGIAGRLAMLDLGLKHGFAAGAQSSLDFVKSLGTAQGWKDMGQSFVNLAHIANQHSARGMMLRAQMAQSVSNYVTNIPNMTAYEVGYDVGYGTEKIVEGVVLSRGAGALASGIRGVGSAAASNGIRSLGAAAKGFSKKTINFGRIRVPSEIFHRQIKPNILSKSGNFKIRVGRNPDVKIINGRIRLDGQGPFKGKSLNTNLNAEDFFNGY